MLKTHVIIQHRYLQSLQQRALYYAPFNADAPPNTVVFFKIMLSERTMRCTFFRLIFDAITINALVFTTLETATTSESIHQLRIVIPHQTLFQHQLGHV